MRWTSISAPLTQTFSPDPSTSGVAMEVWSLQVTWNSVASHLSPLASRLSPLASHRISLEANTFLQIILSSLQIAFLRTDLGWTKGSRKGTASLPTSHPLCWWHILQRDHFHPVTGLFRRASILVTMAAAAEASFSCQHSQVYIKFPA